MVNGIGNVDFMILFIYVSMASVLIRLVRSGGRCYEADRRVFSQRIAWQLSHKSDPRWTCGHTAPYHLTNSPPRV